MENLSLRAIFCGRFLTSNKIQTSGPPFVSTLLILHNGELTLHHFLTVKYGLLQWQSAKDKRGFGRHVQRNAFHIELISQPVYNN